MLAPSRTNELQPRGANSQHGETPDRDEIEVQLGTNLRVREIRGSHLPQLSNGCNAQYTQNDDGDAGPPAIGRSHSG